LHVGQRLAVVSPSWAGPGEFPDRYRAGKRQLEEALGVDVVAMPHALASDAEVYARPDLRARDLLSAFADPTIHGIVASIGGDDAIRTLRHLDHSLIRANPKPLVGYSDTTAIHFACLAAGIRSYYGPSVMAGFGENAGPFRYLIESVKRTLFTAEPIGEIAAHTDGFAVDVLDWADPALQDQSRRLQPPEGRRLLGGSGIARGRLIGGCAEVIDWLRGSAVFPALDVFDEAILFYETSAESSSPLLVTRMLRALGACGVLERLNAIIVGRWGGLPDTALFPALDVAVTDVVVGELGLGYPILAGLDFGHTDPYFTIPYGAEAEVDSDRLALTILEPGVR
jgi:muramoyltetrapeptide carboxypeptidase LdcA involved in peptidoglycan recycling